jgi:hypothetical protein
LRQHGLRSKMNVVFNPDVAERAEKVIRVIVDTYFLPNKTLSELHATTASPQCPGL